jgi:chromosomal replication initiator protein
MDRLWTSAKALLKEQVPGHSYRMWIDPIACCDSQDNTLVLACPNLFSKKRISDHYGTMIADAISRAAGKAVKLQLVVRSNRVKDCQPATPDRQMKLPDMDPPINGGRFLRKDFTFDQFVVGNNSDFAYSAALSIAARNQGGQNALYLLSKTGLGKSHLSQAVGHHILNTYPKERVYYITAEDFMNEMSDSYRSSRIHQFKEKYRRNCDVLLLEDVHFLSGKSGTQEELSNTLESLMNADKKIIYSSCYVPSEIPKLTEKLKSRLCCGLISKIDAPDYKTRLRILKKTAQSNKISVPEAVFQYLASELNGDVRQLKSGLIGVTAKASLLGSEVDLSLARGVVKKHGGFSGIHHPGFNQAPRMQILQCHLSRPGFPFAAAGHCQATAGRHVSFPAVYRSFSPGNWKELQSLSCNDPSFAESRRSTGQGKRTLPETCRIFEPAA